MINTFPPLVSGTSLDFQGLQQLVGTTVWASCVVNTSPSDLFFNPSSGLTGFGFDGFYYNSSVVSSTTASWATESFNSNRGGSISFPTNALILATDDGLTIFDQSKNQFEVWMSFVQGDLNAFFNNFRPLIALATGAITFASVLGVNTMTRASGSWITDGVKVGDTINLSGGFTNKGNFTVTNVDPGGFVITVAQTLVNAGEFGVASLAVYTNMTAKAVQYALGVVTVGFAPSQGSTISTNVFLHIDFIQDQIYGDLSNPLPASGNQDAYYIYMVDGYVVDGYVE